MYNRYDDVYKKAPITATHYCHSYNLYYKRAGSQILCRAEDGKWLKSSKIVTLVNLIPVRGYWLARYYNATKKVFRK